MSELKKRVLITKEDKIELDKKVDEAVRTAGGTNNLHAKYIREIGKQINVLDDPALDRLRSAVEIPDDPNWQKAFNLCVAFLRRYKMEATLSSIKDEGAIVPKDTGYARASDVNNQFRDFKKVSEDLALLTFRDRVELLAKAGEKPKQQQTKKQSAASHSSRASVNEPF
jgi:hypothetical protein